MSKNYLYNEEKYSAKVRKHKRNERRDKKKQENTIAL